jgi:hypothetical protein
MPARARVIMGWGLGAAACDVLEGDPVSGATDSDENVGAGCGEGVHAAACAGED